MVVPGRTRAVGTASADQAGWDSDPWRMIDVFPLPAFVCGPDGTLLRYNRRAEELWGVAPETRAGHRFGGAHRVYRPDGTQVTLDQRPVAKVLQTGIGIRDLELIVERRDGSRVTVLVYIEPLFDEHGRVAGAVNCMQDITAMRRVEDAWRESEQRLAATYAHAAIGMAEIDESGRLLRANETACLITGYPREELLKLTVFDVTHPEDREADRARYREQASRNQDGYVTEKRIVRRDGSVTWVDVRSSTVRDAAGRFLYGIRVIQDISDRKQAEARQKLLLDELNHRVKNTLATVQSLASQSLRGADSPEAFRQTFEARVVALSKAHDLLTTRSWRGAALNDIVSQQLAPYAGGEPTRLTLAGEPVALTPRAALTLSMVFHELATNAAKYGALSVPSGRLDVRWSVERGAPGVVKLTWRESGGPPVAPPTRRGFGSRLIERSTSELEGGMQYEFDPAGVHYTVAIPLTAANAPTF